MTDVEGKTREAGKRRGRKRPRAKVVVAAMLIGTSLVSVALMAVFVHMAAADLLNDTAEDQLAEIGSARAGEIEEGVLLLERSVATLSEDQGVARAMLDLGTAYSELDAQLDAAQLEELADYYSSGDAPSATLLDDPVPGSETARYLQYQFLVSNPFPPSFRSELDNAGDGTDYSAAHASHHETLRMFLEGRVWTDLVLIDADTGAVVYSVNKRDDYATDLLLGPHRRTALGKSLDEVRALPPGDALFVDFFRYPAAAGIPTSFIAAPIRAGGELVGIVAISVPVDALTQITTLGGEWERAGLGETGEVYVVGSDSLLRSPVRSSLENPQEYLDDVSDAGYPEEVVEAINDAGTTVLTQPVETEAVEEAFAGDRFFGESRNYLDRETVTVAAPLLIDDVQWVAVAEISIAEAHQPLSDNLRRVLIAAVILTAVVAVLAVWLARALLRPLGPLVTAAHAVIEGDLEVAPLEESGDEFGELGRTFNETVGQLQEQQAHLSRADEETTELLMAALPRRLANQVKQGNSEIVEAARNGTIIVLRIEGLLEADLHDPEGSRELGVALLGELSDVADSSGVEPVHSTSTQLTWAAGLASGELEAERGAEFVAETKATIDAFASTHGLSLHLRFGLAAGELVAALVGTDRLSFDAWGDPVRAATSLCAVAESGQVLGDRRVVEALGERWPVTPAHGLVGLTGEALDAWAIDASSTAAATDIAPEGLASKA
ncbi:MAG: HAMP domain-containing protein [Acidimicrobiales bacterium]